MNEFTDATGIPVVIVVEDMDRVFSSTKTYDSTQTRSSSMFLMIAAVVAVGAIVFAVQRNKRNQYDGIPENRNSTYSDFDDQL